MSNASFKDYIDFESNYMLIKLQLEETTNLIIQINHKKLLKVNNYLVMDKLIKL